VLPLAGAGRRAHYAATLAGVDRTFVWKRLYWTGSLRQSGRVRRSAPDRSQPYGGVRV